MNLIPRVFRRFVFAGSLSFLFFFPCYSQNQTISPDTVVYNPAKSDSLKPDTSAVRTDSVQRGTAIPHVGSLDRSLPARSVITDSTMNFLDYAFPGDLFRMR